MISQYWLNKTRQDTQAVTVRERGSTSATLNHGFVPLGLLVRNYRACDSPVLLLDGAKVLRV